MAEEREPRKNINTAVPELSKFRWDACRQQSCVITLFRPPFLGCSRTATDWQTRIQQEEPEHGQLFHSCIAQ
jgi:hypothetical protein